MFYVASRHFLVRGLMSKFRQEMAKYRRKLLQFLDACPSSEFPCVLLWGEPERGGGGGGEKTAELECNDSRQMASYQELSRHVRRARPRSSYMSKSASLRSRRSHRHTITFVKDWIFLRRFMLNIESQPPSFHNLE